MTEAEFIELILEASSVVGDHSMNFTSVIFAYIIAGHFVGSTLTRAQFVALTVLYSAFALGIALYAVRSERELLALYEQFGAAYPIEAPKFTPTALRSGPQQGFLQPLVFFVGWAMSIWYVASHRRSAA